MEPKRQTKSHLFDQSLSFVIEGEIKSTQNQFLDRVVNGTAWNGTKNIELRPGGSESRELFKGFSFCQTLE